MNYENVHSLRKYVLTVQNKNVEELQKAAFEWMKVATKNRLSYEIDWLGIPVIQTPEELILMQELLFKFRPDYIIETGIAHGGSLIYYASICELLGKGKVVGVDIEIRAHNRKVIEKHPLYKRIELIEGNSISKETIEEIRRIVPSTSDTIVCLDSDHTKEHVLRELHLYKEFVKPGGYIVVFDTNTSKMAELGVADKMYINNSPKEAVDDFLKSNKDFVIDKTYNKLYINESPDGYLLRIK